MAKAMEMLRQDVADLRQQILSMKSGSSAGQKQGLPNQSECKEAEAAPTIDHEPKQVVEEEEGKKAAEKVELDKAEEGKANVKMVEELHKQDQERKANGKKGEELQKQVEKGKAILMKMKELQQQAFKIDELDKGVEVDLDMVEQRKAKWKGCF